MDSLTIILTRLAQPHVVAFAAGLAFACRLYSRHPAPGRFAVIGMVLLLGSYLGWCAWDAAAFERNRYDQDGDALMRSMMISRWFLSAGLASGTLSLLASVHRACTGPIGRQPVAGTPPGDPSETHARCRPAGTARASRALDAPRSSNGAGSVAAG